MDFKSEFYNPNKKADMLKDILSFAKAIPNSKYIVFGSHPLFGTKGNIIGADYQLKLASKDEVVDYFEFGFTSSQCIPLGIDEDGVTEKNSTLKFFCTDENDTEYEYRSCGQYR